MNIGVYTHEYDPSVGGGFTFVDTIFNAFLKKAQSSSHHFIVFCAASARKPLADKIGEASNIELFIIPKTSRISSLLVTLKHFFPILVPVLHRFNPIERAAKKKKIDLVWFVGGWAYDTLSIPYVATVWDLQHRTHPWFPEVSSGGRWEYRETIYARFLRRACHIITGTQAGKEQLGWYYQIPAHLISIIPHPVPVSQTNDGQQPEPWKNSAFLNKPFFFYPAQFWAHKNHVNLIYALKILKDKYQQDVNLVFTGSDKGNLSYVSSVATGLGIDKNVFALGFVSSNQLHFLYKNAIALAYLSFSGPENLPPLEAFSLNCAVINSDFPGAKEQLGEAAVYVDPHSPADIAFHMNMVINDQPLRARLVEHGKNQIKTRTADTFIEKVIHIFDTFEPIRRTWQ